ncbi:Protein ALP1-like like protein [Argiope bruennichi]|uniref:Protein ALP1-like like protein n=1 Tax=Argiope bruennichi TaxID=94029 RepID=A0A8T0F214_ARGBR|nr:Protein ALP1-like like protein [Argiope bruennichi]
MLESNSDQEKACAAAAYVLLSGDYLRKKMEKRNRRWWMTSLNESRKRYSATDMLSDLKQEPSGKFQNFFRMSATDFESLLGKIGKFIAKKSTNMREPIPIQERLAVTLIFFATGDSQSSLSYLFKFSKQTISRCIDDVCKAIIQELKEEIKLPKNEDEWLCIAQQYENQWNFPSCLRAIDGKHVVIQCQIIHLQSFFFFNYKGTFRVVLLALVDTRYCFSFVDTGCQGRISDGGVFNNSALLTKLKMGQLKLPHERKLQPLGKNLLYVFLGDSAFALSRHMMKPYPGNFEKRSTQRIFNYRLSRARRVVENVFGIMASVFEFSENRWTYNRTN